MVHTFLMFRRRPYGEDSSPELPRHSETASSNCSGIPTFTHHFFRVPTKVPTVKGGFLDFEGELMLVVIDSLAPEVGLEPTTLRLTASESLDFPAATDCY